VELYLYSPNTPSWRGDQLREAQGQLSVRDKVSHPYKPSPLPPMTRHTKLQPCSGFQHFPYY
jgi:hypothetical protein